MNSSASESAQGSPSTCNPSASQTTAFWELGTRPEIRNTRTLVQAFNNATQPDERQMFCRWLLGYSEWLNEPISLENKDAEALVHLFDLECKTDEDRDVYKSLFCSLCRKITQDTLPSTNLAKALDYALYKIDESLLKDDTGLLLSLVDHLLESQLARNSFTKDTYESYDAILFVLYRIVEMLKKVSSNPLSASKYEAINARLEEIESSQECYSIAYHARLTRIGLRKLVSGDTALSNVIAGRRAFNAIVGGLHFVHAISALVHLNLNMDVFKSGIENLKKSIPDVFGSWTMDYLEEQLKLIFRAKEITMSTNDFTHFKECYDEMVERLDTTILKRSTWTMLQYCMVTQLRLIALDGPSPRVRRSAIKELVSWVKGFNTTEWSIESQHVFQALLESLHSIHKREKAIQLRRVIAAMTRTVNDQFRVIVNGWLGSNTLKDKLREESVPQIEDVDHLYFEIRNKLGLLLTHDSVQSNIEDMKTMYCDASFAEVNTIFEDDCKKHVRDFKHRIVCYSDGLLKKESDQYSFDDDCFTEDSRKKERKKESVDLCDLFKPRALDSGSSIKPVKRVLLLGLPGTGKTSISKSLACRWAAGEIAQDFKSVYVIFVRNLNGKAPQPGDILLTIIAKSSFSRQRIEEEGHEKLTIQIKIDLLKSSTLLIIDGLDEGDNDGKAIVERMLQFKCALLFTSRPYYLVDVRKQVDVEMQCLGLNDAQVIDFIHGALPESWANRMIEFLTKHVSIWETGHVPVNLHILCSLWKKKEGEGETEPMITEKGSLHSQMIHLIWRRFVEKSGLQLDESQVLETLGRIAFEAQSQRKALIEPRMVEEQIKGSLPSNVFPKAGFLFPKMEDGFYQFPHLGFQENLAGKRLARLLLLSTPDDQEAKHLISEMKYDEVHSMTLLFMAQEALYMERQALETILKAVDEGKRDVLGLRHIILKLRLAEAYFSVHEKAKPGTPSFDLCLDIVKAGTALFSACQENDALTEALFRGLLQFPNVLRIISTFLPDEMVQVRRTAFKTRDPELSARFLKMSQKELENFLENIDNEKQTLSNEHRINVLTYLPLEHFMKNTSSKRDRIVKFIAKRHAEYTEIFETSSKLLGRCIGSYPDAVFVVDDVLRACTSQDRFDSLDLCFQLLKENCASSDAAIRFLSQCGHGSSSVRQHALTHVSDFVRIFPNGMTAHLNILVMATKDPSSSVREHAILQFGEIAKLFPDKAESIWTQFIDLVENGKTEVRHAVVQKIPRLATMLQNDGQRVWDLLRRCYDYSDIREYAASQLTNVVKVIPERLHEAWELLSRCCCDDSNDVRWTAASQLSEMAKLAPGNVDKAWKLISKCCYDGFRGVRLVAASQLSNMTKLAPENGSKGWKLLSKCFHDEDSDVRWRAVSQLSKMTKLAPAYGEKAWELISKCCHDDGFRDVRFEAVNQLSEMTKLVQEMKTKHGN